MYFTAHRGVSSLAPENTIAAIALAKTIGLDWVEIDVQLSHDQIPVVIHDKTLLRCAAHSDAINQLNWEQLKLMDVGSWFDAQFVHESVPSLIQTLDLCSSLELNINLEIKHYQENDLAQLCEQIALCVEQHHFSFSQLLFSSFQLEALMIMKQRLPQVRRGLIFQSLPENYLEQLEKCQAYSVHCNYMGLERAQVQAAKDNGHSVQCFTPNIPSKVKYLRDWGVDTIITDNPQDFLEQW